MGAWYSNVPEGVWGEAGDAWDAQCGGHGRSIVWHKIKEQQTMPAGGSRKRGGAAGREKDAPPAKRTTQMVIASRNSSPLVNTQHAAMASSVTPTLATAEVLINMSTKRVVPSTEAVVREVQKTNNNTAQGKRTKEWFEECQKNGRFDHAGILAADVNGYVRKTLFPKLKFIMSERQMNYSKEKGSFCMTICTGMGLSVENEEVMVSWWEAHKTTVSYILNQKRADVASAVKVCFQSKWRGRWAKLRINYSSNNMCCCMDTFRRMGSNAEGQAW